MDDNERTDEELAREASEGRQEAFAVLYERCFSRIYDFARRILRDEDDAADATQQTFLKAYVALQRAEEPPRIFRSWIFSIAHHEALDRVRRRRRTLADGDELLATLPDASPESAPEREAERRDAARHVWRAVGGLRPEEQSLLLLNVREGLDAGEIASVLGKRRETVHVMLSRARDAFEDSFTALLLLARGRRDCVELDAIRAAGELSPRLRRRIRQHLSGCEVCQRNRRRFATAAEVLGALVPAPAPVLLRDTVWSQLSSGSMAPAGAGDGAKSALPGMHPRSRLWRAGALAALLAMLIGAAVAAAALRGSGDADPVADTMAPRDPHDVRSTSRGAEQTSPVNIVWSPAIDLAPDGGEPSGLAGYSIEWSRDSSTEPDSTIDLPADATSASRRLDPGSWWFNLSTADRAGNWTHTVHVLVVIVASLTPAAMPTPAAAPTAAPTATPDAPAQAPEPEPTLASETDTPTPEPLPPTATATLALVPTQPPAPTQPAPPPYQPPPPYDPPPMH